MSPYVFAAGAHVEQAKTLLFLGAKEWVDIFFHQQLVPPIAAQQNYIAWNDFKPDMLLCCCLCTP